MILVSVVYSNLAHELPQTAIKAERRVQYFAAKLRICRKARIIGTDQQALLMELQFPSSELNLSL